MSKFTLFRSIIVSIMLGVSSVAVASPVWESLPTTPTFATPFKTADINGVTLAYHIQGHGRPVFLLHGGPANSNYLALQANALEKAGYQAISVDTRGHGRSNANGKPLGYDGMANDIVGLMKHLNINKADFVGWSDGGITALDIGMRYPDKVNKIMAFGANTDGAGTFTDADKKPAFAAFLNRASSEYQQLSPTPQGFDKLNTELGQMYAQQPDWTPAQLHTIKAKTLIVDGDHDEAIRPEHTRYIAKQLPNAKLRWIDNTSHFAFIQQPTLFNQVMLDFLASR